VLLLSFKTIVAVKGGTRPDRCPAMPPKHWVGGGDAVGILVAVGNAVRVLVGVGTAVRVLVLVAVVDAVTVRVGVGIGVGVNTVVFFAANVCLATGVT
jgi:hypothetical protein